MHISKSVVLLSLAVAALATPWVQMWGKVTQRKRCHYVVWNISRTSSDQVMGFMSHFPTWTFWEYLELLTQTLTFSQPLQILPGDCPEFSACMKAAIVTECSPGSSWVGWSGPSLGLSDWSCGWEPWSCPLGQHRTGSLLWAHTAPRCHGLPGRPWCFERGVLSCEQGGMRNVIF